MTNKLKRTQAVIISSIGGGLEMYDFTIYIFFTPILAKLFFPHDSNFISLLNTFAIFAIGYFSRPLGAILFGHYGDKIGRKKGMLISISIMAIATTGIGLIPTYQTIGIYAPILLIILRFFQGIAVGGDLPGAITFVAEYAGNHHRGLLCSLVFFAVNIGLLLASGIGALLTILLTHEQLISWGWRMAFIFGLIIGVVGFYLRTKIAETPYFKVLEETKDLIKIPVITLFRKHGKSLMKAIGLSWLFAVIISQLFLYMPTYLNKIVGFDLKHALIINSINILIFSASIPLMGYLSDKVGRKKILMTTSVLFIVLTYPLYILINHSQPMIQFFALIIFAILSAGIVGVVPATLAEIFITKIRYSGVGISYNFSFAIFAGLTPLILTYFIYQYGPIALSFHLIFAGIISLCALLFLNKTENTLKNN